MWNNYYEYDTSTYYDEWGKAADNDSYGNYLALENLLIDNTGSCSDDNYYCYNNYMHFQMLHDGEYLYVKIAVEGEQLENWFNDSTDAWQDDSVELYFDVGYDRLDAYGDNDYERIFRFRDTVADPTVDGFYSASGMQTDFVTSYRHENDSTDVYQQLYEIRVKLSSIGLAPGETFGLEIAANDDDDGGDRDYKWGWWALPGFDDAWRRPSVFGKAKLQPMVDEPITVTGSTINADNAAAILLGTADILNKHNVVNLLESTELGYWMLVPRPVRGDLDGLTLLDRTFASEGGDGGYVRTTTYLEYNCDLGGQLSVRYVNVYKAHDHDYQFNQCIYGNWQIDGLIKNYRFSSWGGRNNSSDYENFRITDAQSGEVLHAWNGRTAWGSYGLFPVSFDWNFQRAEINDAEAHIKLSNFGREAWRDVHASGSNSHVVYSDTEHYLESEFDVSASWTDGVDVHVKLRLATYLRRFSADQLIANQPLPQLIQVTDKCFAGAASWPCTAGDTIVNEYLVTSDIEAIRDWQDIVLDASAEDGSSLNVRHERDDQGERVLVFETMSADGMVMRLDLPVFPVYVTPFNVPWLLLWPDETNETVYWGLKQQAY